MSDDCGPGSLPHGPWPGPAYRRLTADESSALRDALAPVLQDLAASGGPAPEIVEHSWDDDPEVVSGFLFRPGLGGQGIRVQVGWPAAERTADLADQVHEWAVEARWQSGRNATWPECPDHPNSHPLAPVVESAGAVWRCPASHRVVCAIGELNRRS